MTPRARLNPRSTRVCIVYMCTRAAIKRERCAACYNYLKRLEALALQDSRIVVHDRPFEVIERQERHDAERINNVWSRPARELLKHAGVTMSSVARECGISVSAVSAQLSGTNSLALDVAEACERLSGLRADTLFPPGSYRRLTDPMLSSLARRPRH